MTMLTTIERKQTFPIEKKINPIKPCEQGIIISIKPKYADKIKSEEKKVELRKSILREMRAGDIAFVYSSSPRQVIDFAFRIGSIDHQSIERTKKKHMKNACIEETEFNAYYANSDIGITISVEEVYLFKKPLAIHELQELGFQPPQNMIYARGLLLERFLDLIQ
jgi:predicted transcriptional regulator